MEQVKKYFIYLIIGIILFSLVFLCITLIDNIVNKNQKIYEKVSKYVNVEVDGKEDSFINYPKFSVKDLDKEVSSFVEEYKNKNNVNIEYDVYSNSNIVNLFFRIVDDNVVSYKSVNYSIDNGKFSDEAVFDFNILGNEVLERVRLKYSSKIYNTVRENNFKDTYIKLVDNGTYIYFSPLLFNVKYEIYVFIENGDMKETHQEVYDKVIAFTFDDGPSNYSVEVAKTLLQHDSKATFFELGNRMKYNQEIVKELYNLGMEIGSHTYAHKNLNKLTETEIEEEINSTNILFNEITGSHIELLRPPYGNANDEVKKHVQFPLIMWNVDTEDWLHKDSEYVYNHILDNVKDGDIILMHDIYPTTLEAVKMVLPELKSRGYKITTVSELAKIKGYTLEKGVSYRHFSWFYAIIYIWKKEVML